MAWNCPECGYELGEENEPGAVLVCTPPPKGQGCGADWEVRLSLGDGFVLSGVEYQARCRGCKQKVVVPQATPIGTLVECPNCHTKSSVVLELAHAPGVKEDWGE